MSTYNNAIIVGHLGQDPELRYGSSGVAFVTLSVATSEQWKDKDTGEKKERTDWIRIKASGRLAEICGEYLKKGSLALFSGSIRIDKYQDKDGADRFDTYVRADQMRMLGGKQDGTRGGGPVQQRGEQPKRGTARNEEAPAGDDSDEIPFATNRGTW